MYKLVGADNREYGPISRETVLEWIAQRRANAQTIARFEDGAWKPLRTFEEFQAALGATSPSPEAPPVATWATAGEAPPFSGVASRTKTNISAVLGLTFSIICCCCPFGGPILGLVLSIIGLVQIRSQPNIYSTHPVIPILGVVISLIMIALQIVAQVMDSEFNSFLEQIRSSLPK